MKKISLILIAAILVYLLINTIVNGMSLGEAITIPSYNDLKSSNENLDASIASLDKLIKGDYATKQADVERAKKDYASNKQAYESLAANATLEQLEAATKEETFLLDYLWIVVGNYANDNNVKFMMNVTNDDNYTIEFDVTGSYISIINFIYDLANDSELRFVIDNIQLEGGSNQNTITKGKFDVTGIKVVTK